MFIDLFCYSPSTAPVIGMKHDRGQIFLLDKLNLSLKNKDQIKGWVLPTDYLAAF